MNDVAIETVEEIKTKVCTNCKIRKPVSEFYSEPRNSAPKVLCPF